MALITIITAVVKRRNGAIFTIIPISSAAMMIPATVMLLPISTSPTDVKSHSIIPVLPIAEKYRFSVPGEFKNGNFNELPVSTGAFNLCYGYPICLIYNLNVA